MISGHYKECKGELRDCTCSEIWEKENPLEKRLVNILQNHVGETGKSEGAVEVLNRLLKEHNCPKEQPQEKNEPIQEEGYDEWEKQRQLLIKWLSEWSKTKLIPVDLIEDIIELFARTPRPPTQDSWEERFDEFIPWTPSYLKLEDAKRMDKDLKIFIKEELERGEQPMGVSQWKEHGKRNSYWGFFRKGTILEVKEIVGGMPYSLECPICKDADIKAIYTDDFLKKLDKL